MAGQSEILGVPMRAVPFLAAAAAALVASFSGVGDPTSFRVAAGVFGVVFLQRLWAWRSARSGPPSIRELDEAGGLPVLSREERALVFKHSTTCAISAQAMGEVRRFAAAHPNIPVYRLLVIEERPLSDAVAASLDVRHQSPQLILVSRGEAEDDLSHGQIRVRGIERMVGLDPS